MLSNTYQLIILSIVLSTPSYAFDTITFNKDSVLFSAIDKTIPVITSNYISWSKDWLYTHIDITSQHNEHNSNYSGATFSAQIQGLSVDFSGSTQITSQEVSWVYQWDKKQDIPDAKGIGIEFNLTRDSSTFSNSASDPVLLADKTGWTWETPSGQTIEVSFSPALASLHFERNNKSQIRAMFFNGIAIGLQSTTMTVKTSQAVSFTAPIETRYATPDPTTWHKNILPTNTSPVDLSFLNQDDLPAGNHGFIVANKDKLAFDDGTPAKFWGTNIQAYALFSSSNEEIKLHAKRIAKLGYNLVRIHHHDSYWVTPNIFKNQKDNTSEFSDDMLDKIDWWVKCLKDEGIYLWIDLQVGRQFTEADGITNFLDFAKPSLYADTLGFNYYSSNLQSFMKDFNNVYSSSINIYSTEVTSNITRAESETYSTSQQIPPYKNPDIESLVNAFNDSYLSLSLDPQNDFFGLQNGKANNSSSDDVKSLMNTFKPSFQPGYIKPPSKAASVTKFYSDARGFNYYNDSIQLLMQAFNHAYLSHTNPYTQLAFKDDPAVISLLITNENDLTRHFGHALLADKGVPLHHAIFSSDTESFAQTHSYSEAQTIKTKQTWVMGESKIYLNDVEHRFNQTMMADLATLGIKSLVATTNSWGAMGLYSLPSLTDGSIIDVHSYGRANELSYNPRYNPGFLTWMGAAQISGKPLSVTEWNIEPFPAQDRFTAPIYTASIASLQGWDALMHYGYSQEQRWSTVGGRNYSSFNDPSMMGLMPAAALLYRQGHVAQANTTYKLQLSRQDLFFSEHNPRSSKTIRTLMEQSRFTIGLPDILELPWLSSNLNPDSALNPIVITDINQDFIPINQSFVESDTQELKRDWVKGIHTINTEKSQIISGWIGGEDINLPDVKFSIMTKNAVVAVQSLENKAIHDSTKIFITLMAQSLPENGSSLPFMSEPVTGQLEIYAPAGLRLYPVDKNGFLSSQVATQYDASAGKYSITLSTEMQGHWYLLQDAVPDFEIISPIDGVEFYEGDLVTIKTNADQQQKIITSVDFFYGDNIAVGSVTSEPYEISSRDLPRGNHIIQVHIIFEDGTSNNSKISVTIKKAPFRITQPLDGVKLPIINLPITIKTNVAGWIDDTSNIKRIDFWKDDFRYLGETSVAPYEITIHNLSVGEHLLRARVMLNDNTRKDSKISITLLPKLSIGLPIVTTDPTDITIPPDPNEIIVQSNQPTPPTPVNINITPFVVFFDFLGSNDNQVK